MKASRASDAAKEIRDVEALTTTAANIIVLGLIAMGSAPALAANYHGLPSVVPSE
jgi:hypothetical protein